MTIYYQRIVDQIIQHCPQDGTMKYSDLVENYGKEDIDKIIADMIETGYITSSRRFYITKDKIGNVDSIYGCNSFDMLKYRKQM